MNEMLILDQKQCDEGLLTEFMCCVCHLPDRGDCNTAHSVSCSVTLLCIELCAEE